jgi:formylglycine-generating enzyme required for sulfatase activity
MIGNVWEWTTDWYSARQPAGKTCCGGATSMGAREQSYDPQMPAVHIPRKVIKGGSFLCAPNYCRRFRPAARMAQPVDTSTCHVGLRLIVRPQEPPDGCECHNT